MAFMLCFFVVFLSFQKSIAQSASTPQSEVTALNSLAQQWGIDNVKVWDSTEPCSGTSIDEGTEFEAPYNNPAIKCNCTYNNNSTCHITHLRVYALNTRGRLSEELAALTYLSVFRIDKNYFTGPLPAFISNLSALESLKMSSEVAPHCPCGKGEMLLRKVKKENHNNGRFYYKCPKMNEHEGSFKWLDDWLVEQKKEPGQYSKVRETVVNAKAPSSKFNKSFVSGVFYGCGSLAIVILSFMMYLMWMVAKKDAKLCLGLY